jgi:hypothetical protein
MNRNLLINELDYIKTTVTFVEPKFPSYLVYNPEGVGLSIRVIGAPLSFPYTSYGVSNPWEDPRSHVATYASLPGFYTARIGVLEKRALNRHYTKLKNQKIDLATELSQTMQTIRLVANAAKRLADTFILLKKGNIVKAFKKLFPGTFKEVAQDRLAYVYGIKPLFSDIFGAMEHLAEFLQKAPQVKSNGHAKESFTENVEFVSSIFKVRVETVSEIRVKYGSSFRVVNPLDRTLSQLGFTNPANVIWELVPFSFVVDWFIRIGDFLNLATATRGLELSQSYKTVFIKRTVKWKVAILNSNLTADPIVYDWKSSVGEANPDWASWTITQHYCRRETLSLPDVPVPSFKSPVSVDHALNAFALSVISLKRFK